MPFDGKINEGIIYRLNKAPDTAIRYPYLVVSNDLENGRADLLTIGSFNRAKEHLKKKSRKGTGIEIMIAPVRKLDGAGVAKWFEDVRDLYSFCHSSRCQLVLSSGASSINEMVSGPCFDAILKTCGIDPQKHWKEMNWWLESRLSRRVSA